LQHGKNDVMAELFPANSGVITNSLTALARREKEPFS
jgi:hypothetical protein